MFSCTINIQRGRIAPDIGDNISAGDMRCITPFLRNLAFEKYFKKSKDNSTLHILVRDIGCAAK